MVKCQWNIIELVTRPPDTYQDNVCVNPYHYLRDVTLGVDMSLLSLQQQSMHINQVFSDITCFLKKSVNDCLPFSTLPVQAKKEHTLELN